MSHGAVDPARAREINRARWDELAALHGQDGYYDSAGLIAGADSLTAEESALAGEVSGLDVLHLQCHIGFDAISLARRGARMTGVDFSAAALARAATLARRCGVKVEWVWGEATALPASLHGRFDLVYATVGVLCWIDDLAAWMRSAYAALRPGGRLVLLDGHPLAMMVASRDPLSFDFPYADDGGHLDDTPGSYADPGAALTHTASVGYAHSLGEIVSSAAAAGLRVAVLHEYLESSFEHPPGVGVREADGSWRLRAGRELRPRLLSLAATRPG